MNLRGAKPVNDNKVKDFITNLNPTTDLYNENLAEEFKVNFLHWISISGGQCSKGYFLIIFKSIGLISCQSLLLSLNISLIFQ